MNILNYISNRLIHDKLRFNKLCLDFRISEYGCANEFFIEEDQEYVGGSPPLSMDCNRDIVAVVTELGSLVLLQMDTLEFIKHWPVHGNAIFDISWRPHHDSHVLTSSGDQSICLFDIDIGSKVNHLKDAHKSSIKSISFKDANIFASGARDGFIKLWDLRINNNLEICDIPGAHSSDSKWTKKYSKTFRSCPTNTVTTVLFKEDLLFSGGANDATIKIWDSRKMKSFKGQALKEIPYFGTTSYSSAHGYTSLVFDSKNRLFASCSDNNVYCYSLFEDRMLFRFTGHKVNNFTKIAILKDSYLVSGSRDYSLYIWPLISKKGSVRWPICYLPHRAEVSAIQTTDLTWDIYSCCDDERVRKWSFEPFILCKECEKDKNKAIPYEREECELLEMCYKTPEILPKKKKMRRVKRSPPLTPITNFITVTPRTKRDSSCMDRLSNENKNLSDYQSGISKILRLSNDDEFNTENIDVESVNIKFKTKEYKNEY